MIWTLMIHQGIGSFIFQDVLIRAGSELQDQLIRSQLRIRTALFCRCVRRTVPWIRRVSDCMLGCLSLDGATDL